MHEFMIGRHCMNSNDAADLRLKWKLRNPAPICMHVRLELELNDAGYLTGNYICIVCGDLTAQRTHTLARKGTHGKNFSG